MKIDATGLHFKTLNQMIKESGENEIEVQNLLGQRYIGAGMEAGKTLTLCGTPGNALGAYLKDNTIVVYGNAQDATGDTMDTGKIVVYGNSGDTTGYAMRGGEIYIKGNAGYRVGIHMKAYQERFPVIVIGGKTGDFLGEYQAGGIVIVLGIGCEGVPVGRYCGTGMHGGSIFIRSEEPPANLPAQVVCTECTSEDLKQIEPYVSQYAAYFDKDTKELLQSRFYKLLPNSNNPYRQLYVHN